jgi:hypothetical protein
VDLEGGKRSTNQLSGINRDFHCAEKPGGLITAQPALSCLSKKFFVCRKLPSSFFASSSGLAKCSVSGFTLHLGAVAFRDRNGHDEGWVARITDRIA